MSELSHDALELIARARAAERADASAKRRVRVALAAHLGPVPPAVPPAASAAGAVGAGLSASKLMLICSLTVAGVVGTTAVVKTRRPSAPGPTPQRIERPSPPAVVQPASSEQFVVTPPAAVPTTIPVPDIARPALPEPTRKISMRAPLPRPSEPTDRAAPTVVPVTVPGRGVATASAERAAVPAAPERSAAPAVPGRATVPVVPERAAVAAVSVPPSLPSLDSSSSWRSSNFPEPVPNREVARITSAAKPSKECTSERELRLLSGAQAALRAGNGQQALDQLEQHAATCPSATFWQERSAARVLALCLLHREPQALAEAAQLASLAPRSPLLARLRTSCAATALKP